MEKYTSREPMTFRKQIENFWFYHKFKVLTVLLILLIAGVGVHSCVNKASIDLYVLYMINGPYSTATNEQLAVKLEQFADDIDGDGQKRVQIITISFSEVLGRTDQSQEATLTRLVGQIASGPALFYIMDDANFKELQNAEVEIFDRVGDLLKGNPYAEEFRFDAAKAGFFSDVSGFENEDDLYMGIRVNDQILEEDTRYSQIKQARDTLKRIAAAYN